MVELLLVNCFEACGWTLLCKCWVSVQRLCFCPEYLQVLLQVIVLQGLEGTGKDLKSLGVENHLNGNKV